MQFKERKAQGSRTWESSKMGEEITPMGTHSSIYLPDRNLPVGDILDDFHAQLAELFWKMHQHHRGESNSYLANKRGTGGFSLLFIRAKTKAVNANHLCCLCKSCPFLIKVRSADWAMSGMLSHSSCVQALLLAGCKLNNNALSFILLSQRILLFKF